MLHCMFTIPKWVYYCSTTFIFLSHPSRLRRYPIAETFPRFRLDSVHLDDAVVLLDLLLWSGGSPKNANWGNGNCMGKLMDFV